MMRAARKTLALKAPAKCAPTQSTPDGQQTVSDDMKHILQQPPTLASLRTKKEAKAMEAAMQNVYGKRVKMLPLSKVPADLTGYKSVVLASISEALRHPNAACVGYGLGRGGYTMKNPIKLNRMPGVEELQQYRRSSPITRCSRLWTPAVLLAGPGTEASLNTAGVLHTSSPSAHGSHEEKNQAVIAAVSSEASAKEEGNFSEPQQEVTGGSVESPPGVDEAASDTLVVESSDAQPTPPLPQHLGDLQVQFRLDGYTDRVFAEVVDLINSHLTIVGQPAQAASRTSPVGMALPFHLTTRVRLDKGVSWDEVARLLRHVDKFVHSSFERRAAFTTGHTIRLAFHHPTTTGRVVQCARICLSCDSSKVNAIEASLMALEAAICDAKKSQTVPEDEKEKQPPPGHDQKALDGAILLVAVQWYTLGTSLCGYTATSYKEQLTVRRLKVLVNDSVALMCGGNQRLPSRTGPFPSPSPQLCFEMAVSLAPHVLHFWITLASFPDEAFICPRPQEPRSVKLNKNYNAKFATPAAAQTALQLLVPYFAKKRFNVLGGDSCPRSWAQMSIVDVYRDVAVRWLRNCRPKKDALAAAVMAYQKDLSRLKDVIHKDKDTRQALGKKRDVLLDVGCQTALHARAAATAMMILGRMCQKLTLSHRLLGGDVKGMKPPHDDSGGIITVSSEELLDAAMVISRLELPSLGCCVHLGDALLRLQRDPVMPKSLVVANGYGNNRRQWGRDNPSGYRGYAAPRTSPIRSVPVGYGEGALWLSVLNKNAPRPPDQAQVSASDAFLWALEHDPTNTYAWSGLAVALKNGCVLPGTETIRLPDGAFMTVDEALSVAIRNSTPLLTDTLGSRSRMELEIETMARPFAQPLDL